MLTTFLSADVLGRRTGSIDPRLFWSNLTQGTKYDSFRWTYPMDGDEAAYTWSADAGERWQLANVFGSPIGAWDSRGTRVARTFDRLQRLLTVVATDEEGTARTTEVVTYGEGRPDALEKNLRGQIWRYQDQAGEETNGEYTFQAQVALTTRRLRADWRGEVDWSRPVELDPAVYPTRFAYDAVLRITAETTPDGNTLRPAYHLSGRLKSLTLETAGGAVQPYVTDIVYGAANERLQLDYANGVTQASTYEWTTGRLLRLTTTRPSSAGGPAVQDVAYTYDPAGNVTLRRDLTQETVFCYNQAVEARGDYTYDPLYRLVSATGRQHPGITADTHLTGFKQSLFAFLCPPDPADQVKLENYSEAYANDDSGNLVSLRHTALSASFTRTQPVAADSNRLQGVDYDGCGNPRQLSLLNSVTLAWDYRNQLAATTRIERPDGGNDQDWFVYDHAGRRVRRVVQRVAQGGTVTELDDTVYIGTFQQRLVTRDSGTSVVTVSERRSLRVMDQAACVVIRDEWVQDASGTHAPGEVRERWQVADLLGSIAVELDAAAAVISWEEYFPYGGTAVVAGPDVAEVEPKVYRYSGKECDDSTGLYDYGLRYYATWLGRWLNPDPEGPEGGANLFQFAGGNPTSAFDSNGGTPFSVTDLTDDEVFDAIVQLRTAVRSAGSTSFTYGSSHSTAKGSYSRASITSFIDWSSLINTGSSSGYRNVAVSGSGGSSQILAQWKGTNFEIKAGAWSRYKTYENRATRPFFREVRRKILGKDSIASTTKRTAGDYFSVIAGLAEQQRDTLGGIASFMAVSNAYWSGSDTQAKALYRSYYTSSTPLLSFAPGGGQRVLTNYRDSGTIDTTFKSNLVSIARTFLNRVKVSKGGARLGTQTFTTRPELIQAVGDALLRKFRVPTTTTTTTTAITPITTTPTPPTVTSSVPVTTTLPTFTFTFTPPTPFTTTTGGSGSSGITSLGSSYVGPIRRSTRRRWQTQRYSPY